MTTTTTPTITIGDSTFAFNESGEVLETVCYLPDGSPDWSEAGICDHRGCGGELGFLALSSALMMVRGLAVETGMEVVGVPRMNATQDATAHIIASVDEQFRIIRNAVQRLVDIVEDEDTRNSGMVGCAEQQSITEAVFAMSLDEVVATFFRRN